MTARAVRSPAPAGLDDRDPAEHLVGATAKRRQAVAGLGLVGRLAEQPAVERDVGVDAEHDRPLPRPLRPGARLAKRVLDHDLRRVALPELLDVGDEHLELDPERGQDLAATGRGGGEDQVHGGSVTLAEAASGASHVNVCVFCSARTGGHSSFPRARRRS